MPEKPTHFVVSRLNWRRLRNGAGFLRLPGATRVAAFETADEAAAFRWAAECRDRRAVNPFFPGRPAAVAEVSQLPEPILRDWLADHGIDSPAAGVEWADWWTAAEPAWDDNARAAAWEKLNVELYSVDERPRRELAYAVVQLTWEYNDDWYYAAEEGGRPTKAYRSRSRAEAECRLRNAEARDEWQQRLQPAMEQHGYRPFDMRGRPFTEESPFEPKRQPRLEANDPAHETFMPDEVPFFEVVAIEIGGGA